MLSFFTKKPVDNVKDTLESKEYTKLMARITKLEAELLEVITAQAIIRDKVLRKIQFKRKEDNEEGEENVWGGIPYG